MEKIKCIHCGSEEYVKKGFDAVDSSQIYKCKQCSKKFTQKAFDAMIKLKELLPMINSIKYCCSNSEMTFEHCYRDKFDIICNNCKNVKRVDTDKIDEMMANISKLVNQENQEDEDRNSNTETCPDENLNTEYSNISDSFKDYFSDSFSGENGIMQSDPSSRPFENEKDQLEYELKRLEEDNDILSKNLLKTSTSRRYFQKKNTGMNAQMLKIEDLFNGLEDVYSEVIKHIKEGFIPVHNYSNVAKIEAVDNKPVGILHLTDLHFNEMVSINNNTYNFSVASKRLKQFVNKAKVYFDANNIEMVVISLTGDLMNNQKIVDKSQNQEYNRSYAFLVGLDLLRQVISDLSNNYKVVVASVSGNESRIDDLTGYTSKLITDNFDFLFHNMLEIIFIDHPNIEFYGGKYDEKILKILNTNVLMLHGNTISTNDNHKAVQTLMGKWSATGYNVDFVIYGHIHSANVGDFHARSSSLVGGNGFSNNGLQLYGRASQNIHIIYPNKTRDSIKIDLQELGEECYQLNQKHFDEMTKQIVEKEDVYLRITK